MDYLALRYARRRARWKGNENVQNQQIDDPLQSLDKLCFSDQHYFVQTLYVAGMTQVVLGVQTLLWAKEYNAFGDFGLIITLLICYILCLILEKLCILSGNFINLWRIDSSIEKMEG